MFERKRFLQGFHCPDVEILVFGAGAMGSFFGGLLSSHEDVILIGRRDHMNAIRARGLRISGKTVRITHPRAAIRIPSSAKPELVIVSTKAYDTEAAMGELRKFADTAVFLTLQNGLENADTIAQTASRVVAGTTAHGVMFLGPGEVRHAGIGDTTIGPWRGAGHADVVRVRDVLAEAGIHTRVTDDMRRELWSKLVVNTSINPLAALAEVPNGRLVQDKGLAKLLESVCREATAVAQAEGIALNADEMVRRTRLVARRTAANRPSMLQDLDRGRRTEIDAITGAVLRAAARSGRDAPLASALYALVRAREAENLVAE